MFDIKEGKHLSLIAAKSVKAKKKETTNFVKSFGGCVGFIF